MHQILGNRPCQPPTSFVVSLSRWPTTLKASSSSLNGWLRILLKTNRTEHSCPVRTVPAFLPVLLPPGFVLAVQCGKVRFATRPRLTKPSLRNEVGIYRTGHPRAVCCGGTHVKSADASRTTSRRPQNRFRPRSFHAARSRHQADVLPRHLPEGPSRPTFPSRPTPARPDLADTSPPGLGFRGKARKYSLSL